MSSEGGTRQRQAPPTMSDRLSGDGAKRRGRWPATPGSANPQQARRQAAQGARGKSGAQSGRGEPSPRQTGARALRSEGAKPPEQAGGASTRSAAPKGAYRTRANH